ncbi:hypothetical protein [Sinorhizobium saheli]|uniref:hypothetical protein n=1 Tax=Sinorhizobium saheli TaxID=36856 RepID=UPI000A93042B|nr:hypothetical protein [Sinorhizobium saheli]
MYPGDGDAPEDGARDMSNWMEALTGASSSEAWIQNYRALSRQQAGQAEQLWEVPRRMDALQLNSSDESSAKSNSPDESSAEGGGGIQRASLGGSMRMPPHARSTDNSFNSTRHSIDLPRAHFAAQVPPQTNLRDDLFSSARSTLSSEKQPAIETESGKKSGLWKRIKSGVGKAFGASSSDKPSGSAVQQMVLSTKFRVDHAKQHGRARRVPVEDEALFEEFKIKARAIPDDGTVKPLGGGTVKSAMADLRHLSARLSQNGRPSIAARIGNPELETGLDDDVETYASDRSRRIKAALKKLRDVGAGRALSADIRRLVPYSADATLIDMWAAAEKATGRILPETVDRHARRLCRLSDWLQTRKKGAMAGRLNDDALAQDIEQYKHQTADTKIKSDLLRLRRYQQVLEANRALGLPLPEGARPLAGEGAREPRWLQELPATPSTPSEGAWDWLREQMQDPASSSFTPQPGLQPSALQDLPATPSANAWAWFGEQEPASPLSASRPFSDIYGGLEPLINLNPPTPYKLRDDAHSAPAPDLARPPSLVGPSGAPQEIPDIGPVIGETWRHGSQPVSDVVIDVLDTDQFGPRQVDINGERYSILLGPGGRRDRDVRLTHHPRARPMNEAGPSRQPVADLGFLIRGGWQHRERWLPPYLVRHWRASTSCRKPGARRISTSAECLIGPSC